MAGMDGPTDVVVVATTVDGDVAADTLARKLIECRLAACVQRFPIRSTYRWQGKIEEAGEVLLTAKTRGSLAAELVAYIKAEHSYEEPEVLVFPVVGGSSSYLQWMLRETSGDHET